MVCVAWSPGNHMFNKGIAGAGVGRGRSRSPCLQTKSTIATLDLEVLSSICREGTSKRSVE
jgi:hypothetical protein